MSPPQDPSSDLLDRIRERERELGELRRSLDDWYQRFGETPRRDGSFATSSGDRVEPLYTPLDRDGAALDEVAYYRERLGHPGAGSPPAGCARAGPAAHRPCAG